MSQQAIRQSTQQSYLEHLQQQEHQGGVALAEPESLPTVPPLPPLFFRRYLSIDPVDKTRPEPFTVRVAVLLGENAAPTTVDVPVVFTDATECAQWGQRRCVLAPTDREHTDREHKAAATTAERVTLCERTEMMLVRAEHWKEWQFRYPGYLLVIGHGEPVRFVPFGRASDRGFGTGRPVSS